jgi:mono/diheme cytochrome c family protein
MSKNSAAPSILLALVVPALVAGSLLLVAPGDVAAQEQEDVVGEHPGFLAAKGRISYRRYCASCHGSEADGKGNVAQFLTVRPTDLRTLRQKYKGEFPKEIIYQYVDGRAFVKSHGNRDMPVWGEVFQSPLVEDAGEETGEDRADRKIRELVYYLETLQLPAEGE